MFKRINKKIAMLILTIMFMTMSIILIGNQKTKAAATWTTTTITTTDLGYGVTLEKYEGTSTSSFNSATAQAGRTQEIYTASIASNSPAYVVQWTKTARVDNTWVNYNLDSIAKDFEEQNPGKKVLVATNNWLASTSSSNVGELDSVQISDGLNYRVTDKQGNNGDIFAAAYGYIARPSFLGFDASGKKAYFTNDWNNGQNYTDKLQLSYYNGVGKERTMLNLSVDKINEAPNDGEIAIYFSNYDGGEQAFSDAKIYRFSGIKLRYDKAPGSDFKERDAFALGTFLEEVDILNTNYDVCGYYNYHIVSKNDEFNNLDLTNKTLVAQYELLGKFANVVGGTTFYCQVVRDGEVYPGSFGHWNEINCEVHPRTAFIIKEDGTFALSVIDGRGDAVGMDYEDMANFYKQNYNAYNVFNYDGGGSSCMVVANSKGGFDVVNNPSDGHVRKVGNATLIVVDKEPFDVTQNTRDEDSITLEINNIDSTVSKVFANLGNETKEIVDGKVTFDNLSSKTSYDVKLTYEQDGETFIGSTFKAVTCDIFATMTYFKVDDATQNTLTIEIGVTDNANTFYQGTAEINGQIKYFDQLESTVTFDGLKYLTEYDCKVIIYSLTGTPNDHPIEYHEKVMTEEAKFAHDISVNASTTNLQVGDEITLEIVTDPVGITRSFKYASSDENVVKVSVTGKIVAVGEGKAVVTVTTREGISKDITFTVTAKKGLFNCKRSSSQILLQTLSVTSLAILYLRKKK